MNYIELNRIELEDDSTPHGGTSFSGETLEEFMSETEHDINALSLDQINEILVENGIKPITDKEQKT